MNHQEKDINFERAMKHINTEGLDGMGSAIQILINFSYGNRERNIWELYPMRERESALVIRMDLSQKLLKKGVKL